MTRVLVGTVLALANVFPADHKRQITKHKRPTEQKVSKPKPKPTQSALASWYAIDGTGSCGVGSVQSGYRFASLILSCGTRITICYQRCVDAVMSDHGPYVAGRTFDLNANLKSAIGCPDLCNVRWRLD